MAIPKDLNDLRRMGGVEALARSVGREAAQEERRLWLPVLEQMQADLGPEASLYEHLYLSSQIRTLRRQLGVKLSTDARQAQTRERVRRFRERQRSR